MRAGLLAAVLIAASIAALGNTIRADQIVTVTTTVGATSCAQVQTTNACAGPATSFVQALEFLLLIVLTLATVIAIFLIRLYRRTKF